MEVQTEPLILWSTQTERRKQWISIQGTFILAVLAAPVVLAVTRQEPLQLLKLGYPIIAFFLAIPANNIGSAASFLSAFISLAIFLLVFSIISPIVQWITSMTPTPEWYVAVIPLSVFLHAMNETIIPAKERMEWKSVQASTGLDDKALLTRLGKVNLANQYAKQTFTNVFETKAQTLWEKLGSTKTKGKDATSPGRLATSTSKKKSGDKVESQQLEERRGLTKHQSRSEINELHELQKQAEESMKRIKQESKESAASITLTSGIPALTSWHDITDFAHKYLDACFRNDRATVNRMRLAELDITAESANNLMKNSSAPTQLEVVPPGFGVYHLIQSEPGRLGHSDIWLVPTLQTLYHFNTNRPEKGIFNYSVESITSAELRRPAKVRSVGGLWEVVELGVIAVPA